jgi:hypothetical protein
MSNFIVVHDAWNGLTAHVRPDCIAAVQPITCPDGVAVKGAGSAAIYLANSIACIACNETVEQVMAMIREATP